MKLIAATAILSLIGIAVIAKISFAQDAPDKTGSDLTPEAQSAEHRPAQLQVWDGFWHARINLRYHLIEGAWWGMLDRITRAGVVILAIVSMAGPFIYEKTKRWKSIWYAVGVLSLLLTVSAFIWPFTEWSNEDTILAGRWNQMANEWYALYENAPDLDEKEIKQQIVALRKEVTAIESDEKAARYNPETMVAAEEAEKEYQGFKDEPAPKKVVSFDAPSSELR